MAMNRLTFTTRNMGRNRTRSLLLILSIAIAFFIYGVLASFETAFNGVAPTAERLIVTSKTSNAQPLPVALGARIAQAPGVGAVTYMARMRATYREPDNYLGANAVDPRSYTAFFSNQFDYREEQIAALEAQRDGVIAGSALAQREGWTIGQRIVLQAVSDTNIDGNNNWPMQIVGIVNGKTPSEDTNFVVFRYDYFNAARAASRDTVSNFGVLPAAGARTDDVIQSIDRLFANSAHETRTRTESDYMKAFVSQFADVSTIVSLVVGAAFVTILMIVANTMFFAVRERTREIGVLKILGFSRGFILNSVLAETIGMFALGLALGMAGCAGALAALAGPLGALAPGLSLSPQIIAKAAAFALIFALITGCIPAINAMRVSTRAALKGA